MKLKLLTEAALQAREMLNRLHPGYTFHNVKHACEVVSACKIIGKGCNLSENDLVVVLIAAWYHDTGFYISPYNHEDHSTEIALRFLRTTRFPRSKMLEVASCIQATKLPQRPDNLLQAVLCDADMFHLAGVKYWKKNQLLREEQEFIQQNIIRDDQWCHENLNFLTQHQYHTHYGQRILGEGKMKHLDENVKKLETLKTL